MHKMPTNILGTLFVPRRHHVKVISILGISTPRQFFHKMTDQKSDHLDRTANNTRNQVGSSAHVTDLQSLSPTVKGLTLKLHDPQVTFKAGQWVDMMIPGVTTVGGFSMCSSPQLLQQSGLLGLSVKHSSHPPTHWVHTQCRVGSEVAVRVGGDVFYAPSSSTPVRPLLLLAGGVGINPLLSMLLHAADLQSGDGPAPTSPGMQAHIMFSAATEQELIFKDQIKELCQRHEGFRCSFHVTQESANPPLHGGRISEDDLRVAVHQLTSGSNDLDCYICGPGTMLDSMGQALSSLGVKEQCIHYEKWW